MPRLTKKYYRDMINKSYATAKVVFYDAVCKYLKVPRGSHSNSIKLQPPEDWGRGCIYGLSVNNKRPKQVWIDLYVQGDDTDSCNSVRLSEVYNRTAKIELNEGYLNSDYRQTFVYRPSDADMWEAMKQFSYGFLT